MYFQGKGPEYWPVDQDQYVMKFPPVHHLLARVISVSLPVWGKQYFKKN